MEPYRIVAERVTMYTAQVPKVANMEGAWLHRLSSISAIVFGLSYLVIIVLYVPVGAPPSEPLARLQYHGGNSNLWWAILSLSVFTDLLLIPIALSLFELLKSLNRQAMLLAAACIALFVFLDLAATWTNYASIIVLSSLYSSTTSVGEQARIVAAATAPTIMLNSTILFVYNTLTLSVGILITGLVMLKGMFGKATAYLGIATGVLGILAVVGPIVVSALSAVIIVASLLTMIWVLLVGVDLYRLTRPRP